MNCSESSSLYFFQQHLNDKVSPDLVLGDICRIVTCMKICLKDESLFDHLVLYLDQFITDYLDICCDGIASLH